MGGIGTSSILGVCGIGNENDSVQDDDTIDHSAVRAKVHNNGDHGILMVKESPATKGSVELYSGEPDEHELIIEQLKRSQSKQLANQTHNPRPTPGHSGFNLQLAERRSTRTVDAEVIPSRLSNMTCARPALSALQDSCDAASDLTCGALLAGNPLTAARQRRNQTSAAFASREADMSIRALLRRYQTNCALTSTPNSAMHNVDCEVRT